MPKKYPRRRGGSKLRYLQVDTSVTIGNVLAGVVVKNNQGDVVIDRVFAVWAKGVWTLQGNTAGDGPLMVGLAHSDYTNAEIEECLEAGGSWSLGNKVETERANRKVRRVGTFDGAAAVEKLANGEQIYRKLGFMIEDGLTIAVWIRNTDADQRTAGGVVNFNGIIAVRTT